MRGLIATGYYVAGFAGRSGGCRNGVIFSLISAGMCLGTFRVALRTARAPQMQRLPASAEKIE